MDYITEVEARLNGKQAEQELKQLRDRAESLRQKLEEAFRSGTKESQKYFQQELKKTNADLRRMESGTKAVERTLQQLNRATPNDLNRALRFLQGELKNIERGSAAWNAQVAKIRQVRAELDKVNAEMKQSESFFTRMKNTVNGWGASIAAGAAALTGLVAAGKKAVQAYAEMEQEEANVRKYTGMTAEQVGHLNEEFKKMDTRSSREQLNKLAQEAGRLGLQSEEDVLGFVRAADKINVALDDLGEGATLTLSKLTDIFGDKERLGVERSLLATGSVINELSQNSTAAAPYLAEFGQRLAGVGAQAHMTIPEIMGFGAVLDSQGQKLEMSSTALSKVIMSLFKNPEKIAKATGLAVEEFSETCKRSTNEGLMMLLDRLHELGGIDTLAPVFADMGENGARASAVLAALAGNVDEVRKQQEAANIAFNEAVSIDKEFNVQNTTVQAGLEKARKRFNEMAVELGQKLLPVMKYFHSSMSYTMKLLSATIDFVSENKDIIIATTAALAAYTIAVKAHTIAESIRNGVVKAGVAVQTALNVAMHANPIGLVIAGVVALGAAITVVLNRLGVFKKQVDLVAEAEKKANGQFAEQRAKVQQLNDAVHNNNLSLEYRRKALKELQSIVPGYHASLTNEGKLVNDNTHAIQDYLIALQQEMKLKAMKEMLEEQYKKKAKLELDKDEAVDTRDSSTSSNRQKRKANKQVNRLSAEIDDVDKQIDRLTKKIGSMPEAEVHVKVAAGTDEAGTDDDTTTTGGGDDKKSVVDEWKKKAEALAKVKLTQGKISEEEYQTEMLKLEAQYQTKLMKVSAKGSADYLQAMAAALEAKKKLREQDDEKDLKEQEAYLKIAYLQGTVSHKEYTQQMLELEVERKKKQLEKQKEGTQAYLEAQAAYLEASKKLQKEMTGQTVKDEEKRYSDERAVIQQNYADGKLTARAYQLATEKAELDHLQNMVNLYEEGSEERIKAQEKYNQRSLAIQQKHAEDAKKMQDNLRKEYFKSAGGNSNPEGMAEEKAQLEIVRSQLLAAATSAEQRLQIEEAYQKARYEIAKKYGDKAEMMAVNKAKATQDKILEYINTDGFQAFTQSFSTIVNGMGQIFSGLSSLIDAETDLQTANIEKRYEAEIKAAGDNSKKVAQLEKAKENEIAAVKNEAEGKKYDMQVFQAVAQTAISAINAYSSAAAIPIVGYILAPIAAAMAVAAGGIQIATLKKQRDAALAQGYAEGGYTMPGKKYEPAGVVHAGEWVASQELLANPTAAATIAQLDKAQRTNTIGSLDRRLVSASVSAPVAAAQAPGRSAMPEDNLSDTLRRLNDRLDEPFVTINTVTGDKGILRAQQRYEQLIRNKS